MSAISDANDPFAGQDTIHMYGAGNVAWDEFLTPVPPADAEPCAEVLLRAIAGHDCDHPNCAVVQLRGTGRLAA